MFFKKLILSYHNWGVNRMVCHDIDSHTQRYKTFADTTKDSTRQIQFDTGVSQTIL